MNEAKYAVALGNFDGLHTGHMTVLNNALSFSSMGMKPCALLFDIHPKNITSKCAPPMLVTPTHRDAILKSLGIEVKRISFERIMSLSAEEFVTNILIKELNAGAVCCGFNYHFGKGAKADSNILKKLCEKYSLCCKVAQSKEFENAPISSTRIRECILNGDIDNANAMLGREFSYDFTVVSGDKRGRLIGSPTINQHFPEEFIVPKFGVYASAIVVDSKLYAGVTNIGRRPSFTCDDLRSETCILDFSGNLYGQNVKVMLLKYLRPERVFDSLEALGNQISSDAVRAAEVFSEHNIIDFKE